MQVDDLDPPEIRPHTSPPLPPTSPPLPPSSPPPPSSSPRPPSTPPPPTPPSSDPSQDSDPGPNFGSDTPVGDEYPPATLLKICNSLEFIQMVKDATLASQFEPEKLAELLEPREHVSMPPDDPVLKLSLLNFVSFMGHSQSAYEEARRNLQECFPDIELLSYYQAERRVRDYSGVITWEHHVCSRSCVGFTGPFADLEQCPKCGSARYKEKDLLESNGKRKIPQKVFTTLPAGPQLQARWKHPKTAKDMFYRWEKTQEHR